MKSRRQLVFVSVNALVTLLLAACGTTAAPIANPVATTGAVTPQLESAVNQGGAVGRLEMFSWWTTGGEEAGLKALYALYANAHPSVEIVNEAVAGAGGSDAQAVLKSRMTGGDPPDVFQVHMGHELIDAYVAARQVEPLDDLYHSEGWLNVFPPGVLAIVSANGHYWSVPVDIHRANVLWYNKQIFAANNLTPPATFADFFAAADALKAKGITPLALGDQVEFASAHILETVLLGTLGADGYMGLWTGDTAWADPRVTTALNTFKHMLSYVNADHASRTWDQADNLVISGTAAMTIMGDWVDADFQTKGFGNYGWINAPGTQGIYDALSDTFALPVGARDRDNAIAWLKLAGSREGQDTFNPLKGAIPARTDAGQGNYDAYLRSAMADWKQDTIVPSVVHGAAANSGWNQTYQDIVHAFVASGDVAGTQAALGQACLDAGVCH